MGIYIGTSNKDQAAIRVGATGIQKVYVGDKLVWPSVSSFLNIIHGYLYNWYAVSDSRNIAAPGWHIPTQADWVTLITYAGGSSIAGGKLKETGSIHWSSPNVGATNEFRFNARGSGNRDYITGSFNYLNSIVVYYSTTLLLPDTYYVCSMSYNSASTASNINRKFSGGNSIRLIKDSTLLTNGQSGTYIGNDGKVYRTICIEGQEWLADNLAETKYRNGDLISEITDDTDWIALSTGAMCKYGNDINNV